jgi:hypothetical protein
VAGRHVVVEGGLRENGQDRVQLAVRFGRKLRQAASGLGRKMPRHRTSFFNNSEDVSKWLPIVNPPGGLNERSEPTGAFGFETNAPDGVRVGDVTCIATDNGWLYLAVLLDLLR